MRLLRFSIIFSLILASASFSSADEGVDLKELPALAMPQDAALGEGLQTEISVKEIEALIPWAKSTRESLRDGMAFVEQNEVKPDRQVAWLMAIFQGIVKESSPQASEMLFRYLMNRSIKLIEVDNALTGAHSMGGDWSRRADFLKKMGAQSLKFLEDELLWLGGLKVDTKFQKRDLAGFGVKSFSLLLSYSRQIINAKAQAKALWLTMAWLRQDLYDPEQRESTQKFARDIISISNVLKTVGNPDGWAADLDDEDHLANYRALLAVAIQIKSSVSEKTGIKTESSQQINPPTNQPTNQLGMRFIKIAAGSFMMGSPANETDRESDEVQHEVTLTKSFEIQTTEVTQDQWSSLMGNNPSKFIGPTNPVESVSWDDAQDFIQKLNQKPEIIKEGYTYRLPTEAEWEYAARGGKKTTFAYGDGTKQIGNLGWFNQNSENHTHPVATKKEAYGLFDMHGNVLEWVQDRYDDYPTSSVTDPTGPSSGSYRVIRGGGWAGYARLLRSAFRYYVEPSNRNNLVGFRLVRTR